MSSTRLPAARRGRTSLKAAVFALVFVLPTMVGTSSAWAEQPDTFCNGVFDGATPNDPIIKEASTDSVELGGEVTFTISWHSTGVATADVTDCYRVDDGEDEELNALVEVFNAQQEITNEGEAGSEQSTTFTITIPNDPALIGHDIVDRAKITHGSVESRSALVSVSIVAPDEVCDDEVDNDFDGQTDEGCEEDPPVLTEICDDGVDNDEDGQIDEGCTTVLNNPPTNDDTSTSGTTRVKGTRTLAETGSETTAAAWLGAIFLVAGITLRSVRYRSARLVYAHQGAVAASIVATALSLQMRRARR